MENWKHAVNQSSRGSPSCVKSEDCPLYDLPANATAQQVANWLADLGTKCDTLFTLDDWRYLSVQKGLKLTKTADYYEIVWPGKGILRGHHIVTEDIIGRLKNLGYSTLDEGGSPLKILTKDAHFGQGPNSLHNRMYRVYNGDVAVGKTVLNPDRLKDFENASDMMDALLAFYDSHPEYADMAKAARAYCVDNNVPFTRRSPFDPIVPPWPWQ